MRTKSESAESPRSEKAPTFGSSSGFLENMTGYFQGNPPTSRPVGLTRQHFLGWETLQPSSIVAERLWLVDVAGFLYAVSMHKYAMRDALSANTGVQGIIEILGITGAFVCIFAGAWGARRRHTTSVACLGFATFGLFALCSSWRSYDPALSFVKGLLLLTVLATGYIAFQAGLGRRYFRSIYWSYTLLLAIGLMVGVVFPHFYPLFAVDDFTGRTRLSVFDTFPGTMGEDAALLLLLAPLIHARVGWVSQTFLFLMVLFAGGKTSSALLCVLLFVRFVYGIRRWRSWRTVLAILATVTVAATGMQFFLGSGVQGRLLAHSAESIYGSGVASDATSLDGRLALWSASLGLLENAQALGYGFDGTRDVMLKVASWSGSSHNGYLELGLSAGVLGFVFFLVGLSSSVRSCFRSASPPRIDKALVIAFLLINACIGLILSFPCYFGLLIVLWLSYESRAGQRAGLATITLAVRRRNALG